MCADFFSQFSSVWAISMEGLGVGYFYGRVRVKSCFILQNGDRKCGKEIVAKVGQSVRYAEDDATHHV